MLLKLESDSAMQNICNRIRNPNTPIFGRIAIPGYDFDFAEESNLKGEIKISLVL